MADVLFISLGCFPRTWFPLYEASKEVAAPGCRVVTFFCVCFRLLAKLGSWHCVLDPPLWC